MRDHRSWGGYPRAVHRRVVPVRWRSEPPDLARIEGPLLPRGCGRSYGDVCLNDGGTLLDATPLDGFLAFDEERGLLRCEAGVTLADVLALAVPRGWFPPVLPGTRWVTVGGAIANDIHGKNHHVAGTFGRYVTCLELLGSDGRRRTCSPDHDPDLFAATVGGLGLTGLILWAEIRLKRVPGPWIDVERIRFRSLEEFFALSGEDAAHEYTVAWVDCLMRPGRGIFLRGDHAGEPGGGAEARPSTPRLHVPFDAPAGLLSRPAAAIFNELYFRAPGHDRNRSRVRYEPFFFPLDGVDGWNRLYGRRGFLQYQCVVPDGSPKGPLRELLERIRRSGEPSFLAVLKEFGALPSPGLLSFPRPGATLALDFPMRGSRTLRLLEELDAVVRDAGGAVYPAKDARMSANSFRRFFPRLERFMPHVDPRFSSSFWRRVGASGSAP